MVRVKESWDFLRCVEGYKGQAGGRAAMWDPRSGQSRCCAFHHGIESAFSSSADMMCMHMSGAGGWLRFPHVLFSGESSVRAARPPDADTACPSRFLPLCSECNYRNGAARRRCSLSIFPLSNCCDASPRGKVLIS